MHEPTEKTQPGFGSHDTPRSLAYKNLLLMAEELLIARFALMRCMEKLDLVQLLDVFSEVSETVGQVRQAAPPRIITPRDRN